MSTTHADTDESDALLPEGWAASALGSVLTVNYGRGLKESVRRSGRIPVYGSNGVVGWHDTALTKGPAIVIGRKGTVGAVHLSSEPCWPIDTTYYIEDFRGLDPLLLTHLLRYMNLGELDTSSAIPGLNRDHLYSQQLVIPPAAEQKRIIAKMDELLARVNATRERLARVPAILKRFRQSVLAAACSGRLTADWRNGDSGGETAQELLDRILHERAKRHQKRRVGGRHDANGEHGDSFEIPEGWLWVPWNDLVDWITYGFTRPMPHVENGIPIVTAKNITSSRIDFSNVDYTTRDAYNNLSEKDRPRLGEILLTKDGSIGRAAIVDTERPFCINQSVAVLRFGGPTAHVPYLLRVIEAPFTQKMIDEEAKGSAIRHISITVFGQLPVPLPPPEEQWEISRRVAVLFSVANAIEAKVARATKRPEELMQAVLAKAFEGELVITEAELARAEGGSYEPASALLDRIRSEKAAMRARDAVGDPAKWRPRGGIGPSRRIRTAK